MSREESLFLQKVAVVTLQFFVPQLFLVNDIVFGSCCTDFTFGEKTVITFDFNAVLVGSLTSGWIKCLCGASLVSWTK